MWLENLGYGGVLWWATGSVDTGETSLLAGCEPFLILFMNCYRLLNKRRMPTSEHVRIHQRVGTTQLLPIKYNRNYIHSSSCRS